MKVVVLALHVTLVYSIDFILNNSTAESIAAVLTIYSLLI